MTPRGSRLTPQALGRSNWLFGGSLRSGKRAAAIMSLIQSARINGHDPYAYLKNVLTRLPTRGLVTSGSCYRTNGRQFSYPAPVRRTLAELGQLIA